MVYVLVDLISFKQRISEEYALGYSGIPIAIEHSWICYILLPFKLGSLRFLSRLGGLSVFSIEDLFIEPSSSFGCVASVAFSLDSGIFRMSLTENAVLLCVVSMLREMGSS